MPSLPVLGTQGVGGMAGVAVNTPSTELALPVSLSLVLTPPCVLHYGPNCYGALLPRILECDLHGHWVFMEVIKFKQGR